MCALALAGLAGWALLRQPEPPPRRPERHAEPAEEPIFEAVHERAVPADVRAIVGRAGDTLILGASRGFCLLPVDEAAEATPLAQGGP